MNCLHSPRTGKSLNHIKMYLKITFFYFDPFWRTKVLKFNQCQKTDKTQFINYEDLGCLTGKIDECKNNPKKSSTTKVGLQHISSCFSMSTIWSFKDISILMYAEVKTACKGFANI